MVVAAKKIPVRKCVLTGKIGDKTGLIRCVMGPDGLTPDVAEKLPGRGIWLSCDRKLIEKAISDGKLIKSVARSLKAHVAKGDVHPSFGALCESIMRRRCLDRLGLEQAAGNLITGFDKIKAAIKKESGTSAILLCAHDSGEDGRKKIQTAVGYDIPAGLIFTREELSKALGRDNVVHVLLFKSGGTKSLVGDLARLEGLMH